MSGGRGNSGFTLVEVLVVMAVIAVLAAIVFGVRDGVRDRAASSRAKAELALIAKGLEAYRAAYGDYPRLATSGSGAESLYRALIGMTAPNGDRFDSGAKRRHFVDLSALTVGAISGGDPVELSSSGSGSSVTSLDQDWQSHCFIDPWGSPYVYHYALANDSGVWKRRGYWLLSLGPSGGEARDQGKTESAQIPASGLLDEATYSDTDETFDNIFANR